MVLLVMVFVNSHLQVVLGTYTVVRAALNSEEVEEECVGRFMCEGGREVVRQGQGGRLLVELGKFQWTGVCLRLQNGLCGPIWDNLEP